jgi:hypothetical protein
MRNSDFVLCGFGKALKQNRLYCVVQEAIDECLVREYRIGPASRRAQEQNDYKNCQSQARRVCMCTDMILAKPSDH